MNFQHALGLDASGAAVEYHPRLRDYANLKLAALGLPTAAEVKDHEWADMVRAFLSHHQETERLLADYLPPADWRIQQWLDEHLYDTGVKLRLPSRTYVLDRHGLARLLSLPADGDEFRSPILHSYRVKQGVLHNPASDRRTTQGVFHLAEGGLPIPDDKLAVPLRTFALMLQQALQPPEELLRLPFTARLPGPGGCFVSLLLRPLVAPAVPGWSAARTLETRFFAPGGLVANLDFVESIFGNAGDPYLPENDAGLDAEHWSGHTGCVILAPQLTRVRKTDAGLPPWDQATERQRRDGMCWRREDELYNGGSPFKLAARDARGVMVTLIADNYFGYCKKEVKTQVSFAANLLGQAEEEHAGGALVFASFDLGEDFDAATHVKSTGHTFAEMVRLFADVMELRPEGHAVDRRHPTILYVPENSRFSLREQTVSWPVAGGGRQKLKLLPGHDYVRPSGYKVHMEKPAGGRIWRLVGTRAEGTLCHKPCTVSGGGKSEISKPITDAILTGAVFVADFERDMDAVDALLRRDYGGRFLDPARRDDRPVLAPARSLGSVIKLLTPSEDYTPEYNRWLESIPQYLKEIAFVVKRFHKPEWAGDWRSRFSVDVVNGQPGNELKFNTRKVISNQLRVGYAADGAWRTFGLRKDFQPSAKVAWEDDISASVVVPAAALGNRPEGLAGGSLKFVQNCEYRFFQRPDDAIHRGYDKQCEADFAGDGNFFSNYAPLTPADARAMVEDTIGFDQFTPPMQRLIRGVAEAGGPSFFVCTAAPRIVDGKPTKNPRYLQVRPDLTHARATYLAELGARLHRRVPTREPLHTPVTAVLPGRRNNPPDAGIRPLAVYNPIHYMELPELFMEYVCSMTGKSPSTTGAGSEGALTKGPFNALLPIVDLNNALVSSILCEADAFLTAAGHVGPRCRVDHDISLLIPEIWCRMGPDERTAAALIAEGALERCRDCTHDGRPVLASRLGWRITDRFAAKYLGRIFNHPHLVFTPEMLRPELQDAAVFADGMDNIVTTHRRVAEGYFHDGGLELACPPLRALLHLMRDGAWEGKGLDDPAFRALFTLENLLAAAWYQERLEAQQRQDVELLRAQAGRMENVLKKAPAVAARLAVPGRYEALRQRLHEARQPAYLGRLRGTPGRQAKFA
jgi:hypothetical protein